MLDIVKWVFWMATITMCILFFRALFRKPPGSNVKRWVTLSTPELLQRAFTTNEMYGIAERTAKRHLDMCGVSTVVEMYTAIYKELAVMKTNDGYNVTGSIEDKGDGTVSLTFNLKSDGEELHYLYDVSYIHLLRVTDVLSPALLGRLDWRMKHETSEG